MAIKISPRFSQKITLLVLIPLTLFSVGFFFFAYKFQQFPKTSNDPQMINTSKAKNGIVWGTPEVWEYNAEDTKDWKTYTSPNLGISFKYPPKDWYPRDEKQNLKYDVLITAPTEEYAGQNYHGGLEMIIEIVGLDPGLAKDIDKYGWVNFVQKNVEQTPYLDREKVRVSKFRSTGLEGVLITEKDKRVSKIYVLRDGKLSNIHLGVLVSVPKAVFDKYLETTKILVGTLE